MDQNLISNLFILKSIKIDGCNWTFLKIEGCTTLTPALLVKLICDTLSVCNFVINQFNPTFEVQNMVNEAFQNASFGNPSFPNEALGYSCLWAKYPAPKIKTKPKGNCNLTPRLETRHFEKPHLPCFELQKLD